MQLPTSFRGTERYSIHGQIGSGGFGVVYQAFDRVRGERVALKLLRRLDPSRLYAFKREFRALANVAHPNLVSLYELSNDGDDWFFTMELVEGKSFLDHLNTARLLQRSVKADAQTVELAGHTDAGDKTGPGSAPSLAVVPQPSFDEDKLRAAFTQLVEGVAALHRSGQLHRDLKPSNALVTPAGRVVLLDFGLVKDIGPQGSVDERVVGTVPYMSPEQGFAEQLTPASDLYAIGVMLYQAMTGRLPHIGKLYELLVAKRRDDPAPPSQHAVVPDDLDDLCMQLLSRDPEARPTAEEVLQRLGAIRDPASSRTSQRSPTHVLMGRDDEVDQLTRAFADASDGKPTVVMMHGSSGMGKSALLDEVARRLQIERKATVLRGVCYERESVPYKALDSLMDALSSHLRRLPRIAAEQLMPREVKALARLFPTLERVESIADFPQRAGEVAEVAALRRRAIDALREMLSRMRDHDPLLVCIDDVQWGDADSARLLRDLLSEACPAVMFLFCFRGEERHDGPFIDALTDALVRQHTIALREVEVGPLNDDAAKHLASALISGSIPADQAAERDADLDALAAQVAREARGSPFFINQLAGYLREQDAVSISSGLSLSLSNVLRRRLDALDEKSRRLLEVVAVAARPIDEHAAASVASIEQITPSLLSLRGAHLLRSSWRAGSTQLATFHDRIRESVVDALPSDQLAALHLRLAETLEATEGADAEAIAVHYHRGGELERAAELSWRAADEAAEKLAFERAARLYASALNLGRHRAAARADLNERLAGALADAGRGPEAARAYLAAIEGADPGRAVTLRCRAAEQYFFSGHIDQGTDLFHQVLEATGLPALPKSEGRALIGLVRRRVELKLRGLSFTLVPPERISADALVKTDVCYSVSAVLGGIRPLAAGGLQTHHLLLALKLGEPFRVVRGLTLEAIFGTMVGRDGYPRARETLAKAREVAEGEQTPQAQGVFLTGDGICAYFVGDWRRSRDTLAEAETIMSEKCPTLSFELGQVRSFLYLAMFYMGDYAEAGSRMLPVLRGVRERGDRYAESIMVNVTYRHYLLRDDIDAAREEVARGLSGWYQRDTTVQEFYERVAQVRIALYAQQGSRAWRLVDDGYKSIMRSAIGRVQVIKIETMQLRAQAALLCAAQAQSRRSADKFLRYAEGSAADIEKENAGWSEPLAMLIRAAVAERRDRPHSARAMLADTEKRCRDHMMEGFAQAARWHRGGDERHEAEAWMTAQNIASPSRFATLLVPGFEHE